MCQGQTASTIVWLSDAQLRQPPGNEPVTVQVNGERAMVRIDLPAAGMAILA